MAGENNGTAFSESFVEVDGFRIRYAVAGEGPPLVCLHGAGGMRVMRSHELLAASHRVVMFELPGFGASPVNQSSASLRDLAETMAGAAAALGPDGYAVMANSFSARIALWMAALYPEAVRSIALIAPSAIRLDGAAVPGPGADLASLLFAHPERQPPQPAPDPVIAQKQWRLVERLRGPVRDTEMEERLKEVPVPVLALFGTADRINPPEVAALYSEFLTDCHLVMVYEAAHAIDAERPEALAEVVADFLARHGKFLVRQRSDLIHP